MPEPRPSKNPAESRIDPARPADPKIARLRAERNALKRFAIILGPGLITGASDDDPSGIGTYAQAGAQFGFATLWTTVAMLPMMISVQYMCAKIGLVSGKGLAGVLREHHPRLLYPACSSGRRARKSRRRSASAAAASASAREPRHMSSGTRSPRTRPTD